MSGIIRAFDFFGAGMGGILGNIRLAGVIGTGIMGSGIAQAFAVAGFPVVLTSRSDEGLQRAMVAISGSMDRLIKKEKMTEVQKAEALSRISTAHDLSALAGCDIVIEAISEDESLKLELLRQLDLLVGEETILASNTSSLSITRLAAATQRPRRVIGLHFFNPVPMMELVEVVRGVQTVDSVADAAEAIVLQLGKVPVRAANRPGFVVNRLLCPMINEAIFALGEGLASAAEIDEAMKLGANHPIGPLALCDLIGLDVQLAIMKRLFERFGEAKYRPAPLLVELVEAGYLGRKSGRGFFTYE